MNVWRELLLEGRGGKENVRLSQTSQKKISVRFEQILDFLSNV